jgi:hypothetical protein
MIQAPTGPTHIHPTEGMREGIAIIFMATGDLEPLHTALHNTSEVLGNAM